MKTYIVNMQKDVYKRDLISAQLSSHPELDCQFWMAVEGRKLTTEQQKELISPKFRERYGKSASLPAAGCALSHLRIYQCMIDNNEKYALILEDDAILKSDPYKMENLINILNSDEPVAILLTSDFWYEKKSIVGNYDEEHSIVSVYDGYMTSGYMINKAAAKLLAVRLSPIQYTADAWKDFISMGINLYGVVPHIVSFPDGVGEIGAAGNNPTTALQYAKSYLIKVYLKLLFSKKYIQGHRMSRKLWR